MQDVTHEMFVENPFLILDIVIGTRYYVAKNAEDFLKNMKEASARPGIAHVRIPYLFYNGYSLDESSKIIMGEIMTDYTTIDVHFTGSALPLVFRADDNEIWKDMVSNLKDAKSYMAMVYHNTGIWYIKELVENIQNPHSAQNQFAPILT